MKTREVHTYYVEIMGIEREFMSLEKRDKYLKEGEGKILLLLEPEAIRNGYSNCNSFWKVPKTKTNIGLVEELVNEKVEETNMDEEYIYIRFYSDMWDEYPSIVPKLSIPNGGEKK